MANLEINKNPTTTNTIASKFDELNRCLDDHIDQEAQLDADLDAQERDLREKVNRLTAERRAEIEAAEEDQRRQRAAERARNMNAALKAAQRNAFLIRTYCSMAIAAILSILYTIEAVAFWIAVTGIILAIVYFFNNLVAYATRNKKRREQR